MVALFDQDFICPTRLWCANAFAWCYQSFEMFFSELSNDFRVKTQEAKF
jgi:hypothetical protein